VAAGAILEEESVTIRKFLTATTNDRKERYG